MYSADQKRIMCRIAVELVTAGILRGIPEGTAHETIPAAVEAAKAIMDAVDALNPPAPAAENPGSCPRLHLTIDQRAMLNSALWELGQLVKDLAGYSSVRSWHDRAVAVRAKISTVLTAPNIAGEKVEANPNA